MQNLNKKIFSIAAPAVVVIISVFLFFLSSASAVQQPGAVPVNPEVEERYGIEFTTITLTGETGMIDLRYRVTDVGKAKNFGHYTENTPMIIVQETGAIVDVAVMGFHNHRVEPGRQYYLIYRNTGNAIQRGTKVTIKIDNVEVENVVVR